MSNTVEEATFDIEPYKLHLLEEGPPQVKREKLDILQLDRLNCQNICMAQIKVYTNYFFRLQHLPEKMG